MIKVGTDIVQISRINKKLSQRILGDKELDIFNLLKTERRKLEFLAGRFAVKESFVKATGNRLIEFRSINILMDESGEPYPDEETKKMFGEYEISLSIAHEKEYAIAVVILNRE